MGSSGMPRPPGTRRFAMLNDATQAEVLRDLVRQVAAANRAMPTTPPVSPSMDETEWADDRDLGRSSDSQVAAGAAPTTSGATPASKETIAKANDLQDPGRCSLALREFTASGALATIIQPGAEGPFGPRAMQAYRTQFLERCHVVDDPIEIALVEDFLLVHHVVGKLCGIASDTRNVPGIEATSGAATKFLGELRRLAVTIQAYRTSRQTIPVAACKDSSEPNNGNEPEATTETLNGRTTYGARKSRNDSQLGSNERTGQNRNGKPAKTAA